MQLADKLGVCSARDGIVLFLRWLQSGLPTLSRVLRSVSASPFPATMLLCRQPLLQDYGGDDRARAAVDEEWRFFEASLALLAAAAPLLLFRLLRAAASFLPHLGPTVEVSTIDEVRGLRVRSKCREKSV